MTAPTPWRIAGRDEIVNLRMFTSEIDPPDCGGIVDAAGTEVIGSSEFLHGHEFLPRIIECVNACAGMAKPVKDVAQLRADAAKLDANRCNRGHETLPLRLWDCPECHARTKRQRDELLAGALLLLEQYDASGDFTMGGKLTNQPFLLLRAAAAKVQP